MQLSEEASAIGKALGEYMMENVFTQIGDGKPLERIAHLTTIITMATAACVSANLGRDQQIQTICSLINDLEKTILYLMAVHVKEIYEERKLDISTPQAAKEQAQKLAEEFMAKHDNFVKGMINRAIKTHEPHKMMLGEIMSKMIDAGELN